MISSGCLLPAAFCLLLISGSQSYGVHNVIVCEGSDAKLKCAAGEIISVQKAVYGRCDKTTCASGRTAYELHNVLCSHPTNKVAESCDGKRSCAIWAKNSEFGDPCPGTYKYLEVDYICQRESPIDPGKYPQAIKSVTCEGDKALMKCHSKQVIFILGANYGRHDHTTCSAGKPYSQLSNTHCSNPATRVSEKCNGKRHCRILAHDSKFGDPCPGTAKYLEVDYLCLLNIVACEGSEARLECESGHVISVITAQYGRTDRKTCRSGRPKSQIQNKNCFNPVDSVAEKCNGKRSCGISACNAEFTDPCVGTYKYLEVNYICDPFYRVG